MEILYGLLPVNIKKNVDGAFVQSHLSSDHFAPHLSPPHQLCHCTRLPGTVSRIRILGAGSTSIFLMPLLPRKPRRGSYPSMHVGICKLVHSSFLSCWPLVSLSSSFIRRYISGITMVKSDYHCPCRCLQW